MDTPTTAGKARPLTAELDAGPGPLGGIGLIVLATDQVAERDVGRIVPRDRLALYVSRVTHSLSTTLETLKKMEQDIGRAAKLLVPGVPLSVMAFSCTSGAMVIGEERVAERMREAHPGAACTNPITAARAAFKALNVRRVALLTPYVAEVTDQMARFIEKQGFTLTDVAGFGLELEADIARVTPSCVRSAALALRSKDADAIFISCTALRSVEAIEEIERDSGLPVVSSNQAMAWHAMRLAGYTEKIAGFGRLLRT